jgi:hypothetical protein
MENWKENFELKYRGSDYYSMVDDILIDIGIIIKKIKKKSIINERKRILKKIDLIGRKNIDYNQCIWEIKQIIE